MKSESGRAMNDCPNLETAKLAIPVLDTACRRSFGGARTSKNKSKKNITKEKGESEEERTIKKKRQI